MIGKRVSRCLRFGILDMTLTKEFFEGGETYIATVYPSHNTQERLLHNNTNTERGEIK